MSLINEMLKDLDKRRHATLSENSILKDIYNHTHIDKQTIQRYFWWGLAAAIIIIMLIIICIISFKAAKVQPVKTAVKPQMKVVAYTSPTVPTTQLPKPQLSVLARAIAVNGDAMNTQLTIFLDKATHYSLIRDIPQNTLTLVLDNTELTEPLLPLNNHQTGIKDIQAVNVGSQLKVTMSLLPDVEVQSLNMDDAAPPKLVLMLANKNQIVSGITPVTSNNMTINDVDAAKLQTAESTILQSDTTSNTFSKSVTTQTAQQYAESSWQHAIDLIQQGQPEVAAAALKELLSQMPDYTPARTALVTLLLQNNQIEEAQQQVNEGLQNHPGTPALTKLAAQIYLLKQQPMQALTVLRTATPILTTDPNYYILMAALYLRNGQSRQAARLYDQLVTQYPNNDILWLGYGSALEALGEAHAARQAYQNASLDGALSPSLQNYVKNRIQALQ